MGKFDDFFDDVVVNAKAAASAVSKKASDVYDSSKHKITAAEIRGEINQKLKELGALTYKAQTQNADLSESIDQTVAAITDLKENLKAVNEHISARIKIQDFAKNAERLCPKIRFSAISAAKNLNHVTQKMMFAAMIVAAFDAIL